MGDIGDEPDNSTFQWLEMARRGEPLAQERLWGLYFPRLAAFAQARMAAGHRRAGDGEDVALSALDTFFRRAFKGEFNELHDSEELWRLLAMLAARKVADQVEKQRALKRGGGEVRGESVFHRGDDRPAGGLDRIPGAEPTPALIAELNETTQRLLEMLDEPILRELAVAKLEGFTNEECAERLKISLRSVERKLTIIRRNWSDVQP